MHTELSKSLNINPRDNILIFMPHPDDESVFLAGTIRQLLKSNAQVRVITMTKGEASTLRYGLKKNEDLGLAREKELKKAFKILGVSDNKILDFKDGGMIEQMDALKKTITNELKTFNPKIVITLEPDGIYGHPDHIYLTKAVQETVTPPLRIIYTTIPEFALPPKASHMAIKKVNPLKPNLTVKLGLYDKVLKARALTAHKTQFNFGNTNPQNHDFFKAAKLLHFEYLVV